MSTAELKAIAEQAAEEAVKKTFLALGIDVSDPLSAQRDFAALREWRQSLEALRSKGFLTLVAIAVAGMAALMWAGFKGLR